MAVTADLGPGSRARALEAMGRDPVDVLVVGGGVVGSGVALDAVSRGLSVALVEQRDYASGTSSRSSKLVHGGLRYLEMLDFALVREALEERGLLLGHLAPHLVRPVPFLFPLHHTWERPYVGAGLLLYDTMAAVGSALGPGQHHRMGVPRHRHLARRGLERVAPDLRTDDLRGAIQYYDCQVDDARLVMTIARTAADFGAHMASRTKLVGFMREGGRVVGARVEDLENDRELEVRAQVVVNAGGVWTNEIQEMLGGPPELRGALDVEASKGVHLVVPRDRIRSDSGFITRTESSVLFVIPWGRHWIIGTTDTPWELDLAHPAASRRDIDYVLEHVNTLLRTPLDHTDVEGVYAGLRPLLRGATEPTSKISREHTVAIPAPGLVLIAGGKLTTYRVMARDAVDAAVPYLAGEVPASITGRVPLLGAAGFEARTRQRVALARASGLEIGRVDHLLGRYGGLVDEVLELVASRPELAEPLPGGEDYLSAEVVYAVTHEGARHLDDVLTRRTRLSIETFDRGTAAARPAAELMAAELGWDDARLEEEVDHYLRRVEAERQSQEKLTDQEADEARVRAPEGPWAG